MREVNSAAEQWRAVQGLEDLYEVSDYGRVRRKPTGRILKGSLSAAGYQTVPLCYGTGRQRWYVHALVLTVFVGPRPPGYEGCHSDGCRTNNRLDNLRWDTNSANHHDAVVHGTHHNAAKTKCKRGHQLAGPNLAPTKKKARVCRTCLRTHQRLDYVRRRHGELLDFDETAAAIYAQVMRPAA